MSPDSLDKIEREAYIGFLHSRSQRAPQPQHSHGWTAEQTFDGEAWPTEPLMRAAIEAARRVPGGEG